MHQGCDQTVFRKGTKETSHQTGLPWVIWSSLKNNHHKTELRFVNVSQSLIDAFWEKENIFGAGKMSKTLREMDSAVLGTDE